MQIPRYSKFRSSARTSSGKEILAPRQPPDQHKQIFIVHNIQWHKIVSAFAVVIFALGYAFS